MPRCLVGRTPRTVGSCEAPFVASSSGTNSCVWPQCQDKARKTSRHRAPLGSARQRSSFPGDRATAEHRGAAEPEWDPGLHGDTAGGEVGQPRASSLEKWLRGSRKGWGSVHGTGAGWGQTTPGGLGVQGSQQKARDGRPELGACKPALGPRGSPSCGPGAPLAASQPLFALWSCLHVSGLPSREDEREGLYVAVGMWNQGLHITARKASGRENKGIFVWFPWAPGGLIIPHSCSDIRAADASWGPWGSVSESGLPPNPQAEWHTWQAPTL